MTEKSANVQKENHARDFKGIWIPKKIWLDNRLTYFEKILLAEIHSLDGEEGCHASNKYFMDFFDERERKIQEGIAKLKSLGFIYVEKFDGRRRILKVNPETIYVKFSTSEVRKSAPLTCGIPHPSSKDIPYREQSLYKKENKQKKDPLTPASGGSAASASRVCVSSEKSKKSATEPKSPYGDDGLVKLTDTEHAKLKDSFGERKLGELIEQLNDYIGSHGKRYKSHYHVLKTWNRNKNTAAPKEQNEAHEAENREYANMLVQKNRHKWATVYAYENGVQVVIDKQTKVLRYTYQDFRDKFHALLKKGGYS